MKHPHIHVVYIITKLELGGAQKICLSLFNGVKKFNIHTMLISGKEGTLVSEVNNRPDVFLLDEITREVKLNGLLKELYCFYVLIKKLRHVRKEYPDIMVHTHSTKAGLMGRWAAFFARIKYRIHTIHGYGFHIYQPFLIRTVIMFLEWITGLITTHYVCVSHEDVKIGAKLFPSFTKKYSIIRAAIDWEQFYIPARICNQLPTSDPFIFGSVACFKKQKNLFDLLQAFEYAYQHNKNIRLEIIGDGMLRTHIIAWIQQHNLTDIITLHGWQIQVAPIMRTWHAFVLSSLWEGLPCAIIEARLLKLPVLSYNTGGIADVIKNHKNGLLFEQLDWKNLANAMLEITQDNRLYASLSSYNENLNAYKSKVMIKKHVKLYRSLYAQHT